MDEVVFSSEVARLIDGGIEALRWCRQHVGERTMVQKLQTLQLSVAALTLALNYEMDGDISQALDVLECGDWQARSRMSIDYEGGE